MCKQGRSVHVGTSVRLQQLLQLASPIVLNSPFARPGREWRCCIAAAWPMQRAESGRPPVARQSAVAVRRMPQPARSPKPRPPASAALQQQCYTAVATALLLALPAAPSAAASELHAAPGLEVASTLLQALAQPLPLWAICMELGAAAAGIGVWMWQVGYAFAAKRLLANARTWPRGLWPQGAPVGGARSDLVEVRASTVVAGQLGLFAKWVPGLATPSSCICVIMAHALVLDC